MAAAQVPPENPPSGAAEGARRENVAFVLQEFLTAILRLRSGRQEVPSVDLFRQQALQAVKAASARARERGYTDEDTQFAIFATVAFLDETILNLRNPAFSDWVRKPLQEELFGRHVAGETFFVNLEQLLGRRDSTPLADVLEVYLLCMLLGYQGRYSISSRGDLRALVGQTVDKIRRIRKDSPEISPSWMLPPEAARAQTADPWVKYLTIGAIACVVLAVSLFLFYKFSLSAGVSRMESLLGGGA